MQDMWWGTHWLGTHICTHFVLDPPWFSILDASNTYLGLERIKTSGYVLLPHLYQHPIYLPPKLKLLWLSQFYLLLSLVVQVMGLMDSNVIHGLKHRSRPSPRSLLYIKWWTSSRHELTWLLAFSMIALVVIIKQTCFYFSLTQSLQYPLDVKMWDKYQLLIVWYDEADCTMTATYRGHEHDKD